MKQLEIAQVDLIKGVVKITSTNFVRVDLDEIITEL